jgi:RHS repeat-associated protein
LLNCSQEVWNAYDEIYLPVRTFSSSYNAMGSRTLLRYPSGRTVQYQEYNKLELPSQIKTQGFDSNVSSQNDLASYQYEGYGRAFKRILKGDLQREIFYDEIKRPTGLLESKGGVASLEFQQSYNAVHSKIAEEKHDYENFKNTVEIFEMDPLQRVIGHISELAPSRKEAALNNFLSISPSEGKDYRLTAYDKANNITSENKGNGNVAHYSYNSMNQVTSISGFRTQYQYDALGRLLSYREGKDLVEHLWNKRDQLIGVKKNGKMLKSYEYYPASSMQSLEISNGGDRNVFYPFQGSICEVYRITESFLGSLTQQPYPIKEVVYEGVDAPLAVFIGDGVSPAQSGQSSSPLSAMSTSSALSTEEEGGAYFYHTNPRGNVVALSNESGEIVRRYEYDLYGKATEYNGSYQKDAVLSTPSGSETVAISGQNYEFVVGISNLNGNGVFSLELVSATENVQMMDATISFEPISFSGGTLYESGVEIEGLSGEGTITASLNYTEGDQSLSSTFVITVVPQAFSTNLTFSPRSPAKYALGSAPLVITASTSIEGGVFSLLVTSNETSGLFSEIDPETGVFSFSSALEVGTAVAQVSYTLGTETSFCSYVIEVLPRGALSRVSNPFGFGGAYHDKETGYIWMRSRYYDPEIGRFLSRDPAADDSLMNLYSAFGNNPARYRDPSGEFIVVPLIGFALGGIIDFGIQLIETRGFTTGNYDPVRGFLAGSAGALGGAFGAYVTGLGYGATATALTIAAGDALIGTGQEALQSHLDGRSFSGGQTGVNFAVEFAISLISDKLADGVSALWKNYRHGNLDNGASRLLHSSFDSAKEKFFKDKTESAVVDAFDNILTKLFKNSGVGEFQGIYIKREIKGTHFNDIDLAIYFRSEADITGRIVGEEVQHAIDFTQGGTIEKIKREFLKQHRGGHFTEQERDFWWHRRVFTRLLKNISENNHNLGILKGFEDDIYKMYKFVGGRYSLERLLSTKFKGLF